MTAALTLAGLLDDVVRRHPDGIAVVERCPGGIRSLTYRELQDASRSAALKLSGHGVRRGDVVGVWLPNWVEALVLEFGLAALGWAALGINTRYGAHELGHLLRTGRPVGTVVPAAFHGLDFTGRLQAAWQQASQKGSQGADGGGDDPPPWVAVVGDVGDPLTTVDIGGGAWRLSEAVPARARPADAEEVADGRPEDPVNYFTTSGSTGAPKIAGHDQRSVVLHAHRAAEAFGFRAGDVFLGALPLSGVFGFNPTMSVLSVGGTCLLEPVFDAAAVLADMAAYSVTHVVGGDDLLGRLMDEWEQERPALPSFRRGGIADFTGRAAQVVAWADRELHADVTGVYGSSELFSLTATWPAGQPVKLRSRGGGQPVSADIEVRVLDPGCATACAVGEVGELQFRGYNVLTGYLGNASTDVSAFTPDGWFRSETWVSAPDTTPRSSTPAEWGMRCAYADFSSNPPRSSSS